MWWVAIEASNRVTLHRSSQAHRVVALAAEVAAGAMASEVGQCRMGTPA